MSKSPTPKKNDMKNIMTNTLSFKLFLIFYVILILIPPILGILWITNMNNISSLCDCSEHEHKNYILFYFYFIICFTILNFGLLIFFNKRGSNILFTLLLFIYNYVSYIIIINYFNFLNKNKCECSQSLKKDFLYFWYILVLILRTILIPPLIYMLYLSFMNYFN